jgi:hypothetical protein
MRVGLVRRDNVMWDYDISVSMVRELSLISSQETTSVQRISDICGVKLSIPPRGIGPCVVFILAPKFLPVVPRWENSPW